MPNALISGPYTSGFEEEFKFNRPHHHNASLLTGVGLGGKAALTMPLIVGFCGPASAASNSAGDNFGELLPL
jgi:hypothetical protein